MKYLQDLGLNLESADILVALEIVQAPSLGELSKENFLEGWRAIGYSCLILKFLIFTHIQYSADTISKQKAHLAGLIKLLSQDMALFKRVYRHTFVCSKEKGQKALPLDNALVYWELLFNPPGKPWVTASTNWLDMWLEFLRARWTKSVNKDMWNQTFEFYQKSLQDETLSFWSEDGAWPGVIDDFVAYAKLKRGDVPETIETD
jgi:DCN1-like protein 1/2